MPKKIVKDMSTPCILIFYGHVLIIAYPSFGLATALAIFYIFFGITSAYSEGRQALITINSNTSVNEAPIPSLICERVRLAQERYTYNRIAIEQIRRQTRIRFLENKIASKTSQPFRSLPS
jgi:hypothetical protein